MSSVLAQAAGKTAVKKKVTKKKVTKKVATKKAAPTETKLHPVFAAKYTEKDIGGQISLLMEKVDLNYFALGRALSTMRENEWVGEYVNVYDRITKEFGMKKAKATYLMNIYVSLTDADVKPTMLKGIGWSKLRYITPVITSKNLTTWLNRAKKMTVMELRAAVDEYKEKQKKTGGKAEVPEAPSNPLSTMSFKVHSDQKETIEAALGKAMDEGNTEHKAVALDYISTEFLGKKPAKPTILPKTQKALVEIMQGLGIAKSLKALSVAFPDDNIKVEY